MDVMLVAYSLAFPFVTPSICERVCDTAVREVCARIMSLCVHTSFSCGCVVRVYVCVCVI